jgi:6-phosphogluconate dehydrogenase
MGQNLVLNMERNGYRIVVYNRTAAKTQEFISGPAAGKRILACYSLDEMVFSLRKPRTVLVMVQAGAPVDAVIAQLKPLLEPGDLIIDGGNSYFRDTERRSEGLVAAGIHFIGMGVSGGEEGALWGPSLMPGGQPQAYASVEAIFQAISAKVNAEPCVSYIGPGGAGHYVKMVHNGIEYGNMQSIAEAYDLMNRGLGLSVSELHAVFQKWNEGVLSSYLVEITADVLARADDESGEPLVDLILDKAGQKGTGKWTSQDALDLGVPLPTINSAVDGRILSAYKTEREKTAQVYPLPMRPYSGDQDRLIQSIGDALYASMLCSYAQGFHLLRIASQEYRYGLDLGEVARIWRGGCIIRARFLDDIRAAYAARPDLSNLLLAPFFREALLIRQPAWREVVQVAVDLGIPLPAMSASLAYFDAYRSSRLPSNLIQALRDYFGAHTYERLDRPGTFHTEWTVKSEGKGR